jgi:hypothetical protein
MLTPLMFARLCAFMDYDVDGSVEQIIDVYDLDRARARALLAAAIRERQQLDIQDTHIELLDARARRGEWDA